MSTYKRIFIASTDIEKMRSFLDTPGLEIAGMSQWVNGHVAFVYSIGPVEDKPTLFEQIRKLVGLYYQCGGKGSSLQQLFQDSPAAPDAGPEAEYSDGSVGLFTYKDGLALNFDNYRQGLIFAYGKWSVVGFETGINPEPEEFRLGPCTIGYLVPGDWMILPEADRTLRENYYLCTKRSEFEGEFVYIGKDGYPLPTSCGDEIECLKLVID